MLRTMKTRVARGRYGKDEGFTLIELMVVVLIIAILLAIAIPTFLGAQNKAKDRSAQSSLRNTLTAAKTIYTDKQLFTDATTAALTLAEPNLVFIAAATSSADPKSVSIAATADTFIAASKSKAGTCFYIKEDLTNGTATGTRYQKVASAATCKASDAVTIDQTEW